MKKFFELILMGCTMLLLTICFSAVITWMISVILLVPALLFASFGVMPWNWAAYVFIVCGVGMIFTMIFWATGEKVK